MLALYVLVNRLYTGGYNKVKCLDTSGYDFLADNRRENLNSLHLCGRHGGARDGQSIALTCWRISRIC